MDCGTFLLMQSPNGAGHAEMFSRATDMAQAADRMGFDSIWCAEHHFSTYGYLSRPLMLAMHLAAHTERIRVGSAVIVLPLHHPLVVAEEIATADLLSGGRLDVGLGRGYQRYEFERLGADLAESRGRFDEAIDIILDAFKGEPFSHDGEYYHFDETSIFPLPIQQPHPPIWVVGQSPESIATVAERGFNLVSGGFGVSVERLAQFRQAFDSALPGGKQPEGLRISTQRAVYVTHDESELPAIVEQARWNMRVTLSLRQGLARVERGRAVAIPMPDEPSTEDLLDRYFVMGTPDTCLRKIAEIREIMGIDHFNANFWFGAMSQRQVLGSMQLFADEILPVMKSGDI